ncbi:transcription factor [Clostridium cadaveris]|uniref:transcription factor n=1 Tax=Clostridium cadaveris TaxID=1529 RepID=UPI0031CE94B1
MKKGETIDPVLISRQMLAERWSLTPQAILNYENEGVITRNPHIPTPRYSLSEILKIEDVKSNPMSPLERRRLENRIKELEEIVTLQNKQIIKMSMLGTESINLLEKINEARAL